MKSKGSVSQHNADSESILGIIANGEKVDKRLPIGWNIKQFTTKAKPYNTSSNMNTEWQRWITGSERAERQPPGEVKAILTRSLQQLNIKTHSYRCLNPWTIHESRLVPGGTANHWGKSANNVKPQ